MVHKWIKQKSLFIDLLKNDNKSILKSIKVGNSGRKIPYVDLDTQLFEWVKERNAKGFVVKDKYLIAKGKSLANDLEIDNFKCSGGFISNFKNRHELVCRAQTTCRKIPTMPSLFLWSLLISRAIFYCIYYRKKIAFISKILHL